LPVRLKDLEEGKKTGEDAPLSYLACYFDPAAVGFDDLLGNRQP
jgi:hypothetical protein